MSTRHGGRILVDQLRIQGVERVFCIPGESYLAVLDGLYGSGIQTIVCRQEGGAAMMAEAEAKLSGKPGIAFVTRGPGATNAASGVHVAFQDSTPMILFIGQVATDQRDREAFQEVDYRRMFAPLAKWVGEIDRTDRIPEYLSHAFHLAVSGRPGPVILALPEDILSNRAEVADTRLATPAIPRAHPEDAARVRERLTQAQRPMVIVGGGGWTTGASRDLATVAEALDLPVGASFRCQDYLDNDHPHYVGDVGIGINPALAQRVRDADALLVLGARLGEMTTSGYSLVSVPDPSQSLIHVHPGADELGRVYRPDLAINATAASLLAEMAKRSETGTSASAEWRRAARDDYEAWNTPVETPGAVKLEQVVQHLRAVLPGDAIVTNGAGNYTAWVHRYFRYRGFRTQLAPTSGSMGYGLPAAVAAKIVHPDRTVICFAGDGCFQMSSQEFATAVQHGTNVVVLLVNNGMYGTIRMHQARHYPGRVSATDLVNPDFAALARAYGGYGEVVETTEAFPEALGRALAAGTPALLELRTDPEALTPMQRLSAME
jgi:acetolactate synthase-1/2/3 large subunit